MADHLERHPAPVLGQLHASVGLVLDEPELGQPLDHPRGRSGRHPEPLRQGVGRDRLAGAQLQRVDRLRVVLDRRGDARGLMMLVRHE